MKTGTIITVRTDYGFIRQDTGGVDCFVHKNQVFGMEWGPQLQEMRVAYDVEHTARGPRANNVKAAP